MGISNDVELAIQRMNTDAFITAWPETLALSRQTKISDGQGGWTFGPPTSLPPQQFAVLSQNTQLEERLTLDGQMVRPDYKLVGYSDANVQRGDWFTWKGQRYDVVYVYGNRDYETLVEVVYRG